MDIKKTKNIPYLREVAWLLGLLIMVTFFGVIFNKESQPEPQQPKEVSPALYEDENLNFILQPSTFEQVLDHFSNHTIFLSVYDEAANKLTADFRKKMKQMGGHELSQLEFRESYVAVIQGGEILEEKRSAKDSVFISFEEFKIFSAGNLAGNQCYLQKGDDRFPSRSRGLNMFVVNQDKEVLANYAFDFFLMNTPRPVGRVLIPFYRLLDQVEIVVKEGSYLKLQSKKEEAQLRKVLISEDDDFVPARVYYKDQQLKGDIRLKGDWTDHLEGEQWSFRVKLKSGQTLEGMRKFSLHHPKTRNFAGEWLFHKLLEEEGILNLQYKFVRVNLTILGETTEKKELGVYALEEFFDKYLVERNRRREGVILKIDEDPLWQERADIFAKGLTLKDLNFINLIEYEQMKVLPFSAKKVMEDPTLKKSFLAGKSLVQGYVENSLKISEVFDVELLAKYNAICNIMGANHALLPHNFRFYYNPVNGKLEPIGFDANAGLREWIFFTMVHAYEDPEFMEAYVKALEEITTDEYIENLKHWPELDYNVAMLQGVYPEFEWDPQAFDHNRQVLLQSLFPTDALNAFFVGIEDGYLQVDVENYGKFPVQIKGVKNEQNRVFAEANDNDNAVVMPRSRKVISLKLGKHFQRLFVQKKQQKTGFNSLEDIPSARLIFQNLGSKIERTAGIVPWKEHYEDIAQANLFRYQPNPERFDFLEVDEAFKTITCKPGVWKLEEPLILPAGYIFKAGPGCRIDLFNHRSKIISYAALHWEGDGDDPVELVSTNLEGEGLIVLNVKDTSVLRNCRFSNLSEPTTRAWGVTGAVNFYDAPVKIYNCAFTENHCEDALNIIKTGFTMDNAVFRNTHADAFDGDFVTGEITNSLFVDLGNDAVDVSGSEISLENLTVINAGDKAVSAGEKSQLTIKGAIIKSNEIGIAAKDKSIVEADQVLLENNKLAFTAFQKKSEFGPATIIATQVELKQNEYIHLVELGSVLKWNGKLAETVEVVKELMYGIEFGKESE